jgi:hypothetical protein
MNYTIENLMPVFGTQSALAEFLGVTRGAVTHWKRMGGIPQMRQYQIRILLSDPKAISRFRRG